MFYWSVNRFLGGFAIGSMVDSIGDYLAYIDGWSFWRLPWYLHCKLGIGLVW
jgi:hypothetical protein